MPIARQAWAHQIASQHLLTDIHQIADDEAEAFARRSTLLRVQEVKGDAEDKEVCEERVEMRFEAEMNDVVEVGMVQMSEDAKELGADQRK